MPLTATRPELAVKSCAVVIAPPPSPPKSRLANRLTVGVFLLFLTVPLVGALVKPPTQPTNEKRPLNPAPVAPTAKWKLKAFPPVFDAYFGDRIGYRKDLLDLRQRLLVEALGDSIADTVWVGRDGWLFINCTGVRVLPALEPDPAGQVQQWADALDERRQWLAAQGIRYVVMVAPEKSSVYPEHLPAWVSRHPPPDLLTPLTARVPDVTIVNPLPAVLAAKANGPAVYHQFDSHWTDVGAHAAYRELAKAAGQPFQEQSGFLARTLPADERDLAQALGRADDDGVEQVVRLDDLTPPAELPTGGLAALMEPHADRLKNLTPHLTESGRGRDRAVLLHDSFGSRLQRLMAGDYRRLAAVGTYGFPTNLIEAERPDVVIQVLVARALPFVPPARIAKMTP